MVKTMKLSCYAIFTGPLGWCEKSSYTFSPYAINLLAEWPSREKLSAKKLKTLRKSRMDVSVMRSQIYASIGSLDISIYYFGEIFSTTFAY